MDKRMEAKLLTANELQIEMLIRMAEHDTAPMFDLIKQVRPQLMELDIAARQQVAQRPYLLVDFGFRDTQAWQGIAGRLAPARDTAWNSRFPRRSAVELGRRVLTLAWHTIGADTPRACIQLGISLRVTEIISQMKLKEIERVAGRHIGLLRPRWDDRSTPWHRFLKAARNADTQVLESIDLHGAQLLASDLMSEAG